MSDAVFLHRTLDSCIEIKSQEPREKSRWSVVLCWEDVLRGCGVRFGALLLDIRV